MPKAATIKAAKKERRPKRKAIRTSSAGSLGMSIERLLRMPPGVYSLADVLSHGACTTLSGYGPRNPLDGDD